MSIPENNKFIEFQDKIISMPLWVKQAIFLNLKENLEANITIPFVNTMAKDTTFQFYIPSITFKGRQELETRELGLDINLYKFLEFAQNKTNIAEITIISRWTLEECATCFLDAIEKEFIEKPSSDLINGTVAYLSGTIRLGEYFTRIGKITIEQLDQALRTQKQIIESSGDRIGIGEVMLNLNFITEKDMQAILHIKDEAKKRFIIDANLGSTQPTQPISNNEQVIREIDRLKKENLILKTQLKKILSMTKKGN